MWKHHSAFWASDHPCSGKITSDETDADNDQGKRTVTSRLEIKKRYLNVEQRDSRKIQAKIVPSIKLVINQLMKRIVWHNCGSKGFEHRTPTGKSPNLICGEGENEVGRGERPREIDFVGVLTMMRMRKYLSLVCEGELLSEECKKKCWNNLTN